MQEKYSEQNEFMHLYSDVIFSGNRSLLSFHVWAKKMSAAYVCKNNLPSG